MELINYFWILPLVYLGFYLFFTFLKASNNYLDKLIFCSVCFSFFSALILGIFLKFNIIILALMMGMSVSGITYKIKEVLEEKNKTFISYHFVIQLCLTLIGLGIILMIK